MKLRPSPRRRIARGLTLLELTVVLSVLLAIAAVAYVGARAWKDGADRANCVMAIRNVQQAVRSYQNVYDFDPGSTHPGLAEQLLEREFLTAGSYDQVVGLRDCPGGGAYSSPDLNRFPWFGESYMNCSLGGSDGHEPVIDVEW